MIRDDIQQVAYLARVSASRCLNFMLNVLYYVEKNPDHELSNLLKSVEYAPAGHTIQDTINALVEFGDEAFVWQERGDDISPRLDLYQRAVNEILTFGEHKNMTRKETYDSAQNFVDIVTRATLLSDGEKTKLKAHHKKSVEWFKERDKLLV